MDEVLPHELVEPGPWIGPDPVGGAEVRDRAGPEDAPTIDASCAASSPLIQAVES